MLDSRGFADVTPFIVKEAMGDQNGEDEYIFAGDENGEEFTFSLVYHGFQYVEISGLSGPLPFGDITALLLSTDSARSVEKRLFSRAICLRLSSEAEV